MKRPFTPYIACLAWFIATAGGFSADDMLLGQSIRGFRYPDYDSQGQLKMEISGDKAQILPENMIKITNLQMTFYEEGKAAMHISTPLCFYDRVKNTAVSTAEVCMTRTEINITGTGFDWNEKEGRIRIKNNARVILQKTDRNSDLENDRADPQASRTTGSSFRAGDTNDTVITSTRLTFDQKKMIAVFEGNVVATDPALKIESERLTVSFSNAKKVELIEAEGNVVITRDTVHATAKTAAYAIEDGKITLFGKPLVTRQKDSLTAETIVLWRNSSRIICEPNANLTIYSDQEMHSPLAKD